MKKKEYKDMDFATFDDLINVISPGYNYCTDTYYPSLQRDELIKGSIIRNDDGSIDEIVALAYGPNYTYDTNDFSIERNELASYFFKIDDKIYYGFYSDNDKKEPILKLLYPNAIKIPIKSNIETVNLLFFEV